MNILKIGHQYLNLDQVTRVEDDSYAGHPSATVILTNLYVADEGASYGESLTFKDSDAAALLEWLNAYVGAFGTDIMRWYADRHVVAESEAEVSRDPYE